MSFLDRLFRRYRKVDDWADLADGRIRVRGRAETSEPLIEPLGGESAIAIDYRAWPPATTIGADGATAANSRAFQVQSRQTVDFELVDAQGRRLRVAVDPGDDVSGLHVRLLQQYGVGLRAEVDLIEPGQDVEVEGTLQLTGSGRSPHRTDPLLGTVVAHRYWGG